MPKYPPLKERIIQGSTPITEAGCWIWMNAVTRAGYGLTSMNGKAVSAHRASWIAFNGTIPDGMNICHKCDVKLCVNPDHLFVATQADNMADMIRKGRSPDRAGEKHGIAKLSNAQVLEIREDTRSSGVDLARRFGVTRSTISDIRRGRSRRRG